MAPREVAFYREALDIDPAIAEDPRAWLNRFSERPETEMAALVPRFERLNARLNNR